MKKLSILVLVVAGLSLASCKKDRTCTCSITYVSSTANGVSQTIPVSSFTQTSKLTKVTKKGAHCLSGEQTKTETQGGVTTVDVVKADCKLS